MTLDKSISTNTRKIALSNTERIFDELSLLTREIASRTLELNNASKDEVDLIIKTISKVIEYLEFY
jgi:hypothetical protein